MYVYVYMCVCVYVYVYIRHRAFRHSCVYNPCRRHKSSSPPVFQFSSLPVLQSSSFPDPVPVGVGVWRPILENPFLGGCRGDTCGPPRGFLPPRRSPRRLSSPILPRLGAPVRHLGTKMPQHLPRYPKNTILEPTSSSRAPKILPRQPPGPSRGGPKPQKTTKSDRVLVVFTLQPFFQ